MEHQGARLGSLIGAVAGLVFVVVNAGGLPGSELMRAAAVVVFAVVVATIVRSRLGSPQRVEVSPADR